MNGIFWLVEWIVDFLFGVDISAAADAGADASALGTTCLLCSFIGYYIVGLLVFTEAVYTLLKPWFFTIAPVLTTIWIGVNVAKLMIGGGEGGYQVIFSCIKKLLLLGFISLVLSVGGGKWFYNTAGPLSLSWGYEFSNSLRAGFNSRLEEFSLGAKVPTCVSGAMPVDVRASADKANIDKYGTKLLEQSSEAICAIEKTHAVGMVAGLAVMASTPHESWWEAIASFVTETFASMMAAIMKLFIGFFIMGSWGYAAIYFCFQLIDYSFRILFNAAISPLLLMAYMFKSSERIAQSAFSASVGAVAGAATLGLTLSLTLFMMSNVTTIFETAQVYLADVEVNGSKFDSFSIGNDPDKKLYNFLMGMIRGDIPSEFTSPWMLYIIVSSFITMAAGKKLTKMVSEYLGTGQDTEFADAGHQGAKRLTTYAAAGAATGIAASGLAMMGLAGGGAVAIGAAKGAGMAGLGNMGATMKTALGKVAAANPMGSSKLGAKNSALGDD